MKNSIHRSTLIINLLFSRTCHENPRNRQIVMKYLIFNVTYVLVCLDFSNAFVSGLRGKKHKAKDGMEGKIVGGTPIPLSRMPYNVQIFNQGSMCAGTILNSWTILTAAHCFDISKDIAEMVVQVGKWQLLIFFTNFKQGGYLS